MTFKILTDSTADLLPEWTEQHDVLVLGLTVQLDGQTYETVGENRLTSPVLLEKMKAGSKPTTSQINVGQFEDLFRQVATEGQELLYVAFSSVLSGTYQSAVMARELVMEDFPNAVIEIIDTKAASAGEGYLVMQAVAVREAGGSLADAKAKVEDLALRLRTFLVVDDLDHLVRGGRLSKAAALIGGLMNIKPIIAIGADGSLGTVAKARGRKKALAEVSRLALDQLDHGTLIIAYSDDREPADSLKETLLGLEGVEEVLLFPLGPIIATHVGPGTVGLFSIGKQAR